MWTTEKEIKQQLEKYWNKGIFLTSVLKKESLFPFKLKLIKPNNQDITEQFHLVQKWVSQLTKIDFIHIDWITIKNRIQGEQCMPNSLWIENIEDVLKILNKNKEYQNFLAIVEETKAQNPRLLVWLEKYPFKALSVAREWQKILSVVNWMQQHPQPKIYLRQVDIPHIHTKFIEQHSSILSELLDIVLPEETINKTFSGTKQFSARYGFLEKKTRIRFRNLDSKRVIFLNILQSDVTLDAESFAQLNPDVRRIIIVENETTYLALPDIENAWAIWGAGYGWQGLGKAKWLADCEIYYWGDLDTHGFAILDRLREYFPHTISFLMDQETLRDYADLWSKESKPQTEQLTRLTFEEMQLYQALQTNKFGQNVRLEQELIPFSVVEFALKKVLKIDEPSSRIKEKSEEK